MSKDYRSLRVGVLHGGLSSEREVSLKTGAGVHRALVEKGYDAVLLDWKEGVDPTALLRDAGVEVVWLALHGTYGEDGCIQGLLECLRIPYTGSDVVASSVAMDKLLSKRLFRTEDVPTPAWALLPDGVDPAGLMRSLGFLFPTVVKPSREGSTVGITIVKTPAELGPAVELARGCHGQTFLEAFIAGREISVGILADEVLGTVEIVPKVDTYDYDAKYVRGDTEYLVPAPLDPPVDRAARTAALDAYRALGASGYARVDVRIDDAGKPWVLEVNTLPGMTGTSLLPKIAAHAGIGYADLVERILRTARLHA